MTLSTQVPRVVITGNGTRGPYSLVDENSQAMRFTSMSHVKLTRYPTVTTNNDGGSALTLNVHYTVGGTQDARTFTLDASQDVLTSTERIVAERVQSYEQDLSLVTGGAFNAQAVQARFDKVEEKLQELKAQLARTVLLQFADSTTSVALPSPPTSETKLLGRNTAGQIAHVDIVDVSPDALALGSGWLTLLGLPAAGTLDNLAGVRFVSTYAALTALVTATGLSDNSIYYTYGRSGEEDGGEGFWRYDSGATDTANGGTILALDGGGAGRFFRLYDRSHVSVRWFGPAGNDSADDRAAWQAAYDASEAGGWLHGYEARFRISSRLNFRKSVNIDFGGATLVLNNSSSPNNRHMYIASELGDEITWTETIAANSAVLTIATGELAVGDEVMVYLGEDPYDSNEQHWVRYCKVIANSGSTVTLDARTPYAINGTDHSIRKILTPVAECEVKNLKLDYVSATVPDTSVYIEATRNLKLTNLHSIKSRIGINAIDSRNLVVSNVTGEFVKAGVSSHGRMLTGWQLENCEFKNLQPYSSDNNVHILLESWCRNLRFTSVDGYSAGASASAGAFHIAGGSYGIIVDGLQIDASHTSQQLVSSGGDDADFKFSNVRFRRTPHTARFAEIESWADDQAGVDFLNTPYVTARAEINLQPSMSDYSYWFCSGFVRRIWLYVESTTGVTNIYVNGAVDGVNTTSQLVAGKWVELTQVGLYGTGVGNFNATTNLEKRLSIYTDATMPVDTKLRLIVEYWPYSLTTSQYLFPVESTKNEVAPLLSRTSTQIADVTNTINTSGKFAGKQVFDTTNHRLMIARAGLAASVWDVVDGSASVTPT